MQPSQPSHVDERSWWSPCLCWKEQFSFSDLTSESRLQSLKRAPTNILANIVEAGSTRFGNSEAGRTVEEELLEQADQSVEEILGRERPRLAGRAADANGDEQSRLRIIADQPLPDGLFERQLADLVGISPRVTNGLNEFTSQFHVSLRADDVVAGKSVWNSCATITIDVALKSD
jgi:hypothetical protein